MDILILGKNGQLGHALVDALTPLGHVIALGRHDVDLKQVGDLIRTLDTLAPNIIINAAAYTQVDKAESEIESSHHINARVPKVLADYASQSGSLLIHYSSDYVFDGSQSVPYRETDKPNPLNRYGQSKLAGDLGILDTRCQALIFRVSWLFSFHGNNFIKTMLRLAHTHDHLRVVDDQHGAPTSAALVAEITKLAIIAWRKRTLETGLYHLTAMGAVSWHGLADYVIRRARMNHGQLKLLPENIEPIATQDYPLPAKRPANSRLNTDKLRSALGITFPDWKHHVDLVVDQLLLSRKKFFGGVA